MKDSNADHPLFEMDAIALKFLLDDITKKRLIPPTVTEGAISEDTVELSPYDGILFGGFGIELISSYADNHPGLLFLQDHEF